jgi:hypothetical protein
VAIIILFVVLVLAVAGGILYFRAYLPAHLVAQNTPSGQPAPTTASAPSQPGSTAASFHCADLLPSADIQRIFGIDPATITTGESPSTGGFILGCNAENTSTWFNFTILSGSHYAPDLSIESQIASTTHLSGIGDDAFSDIRTGDVYALTSNQKYEIDAVVASGGAVSTPKTFAEAQAMAKVIDNNLSNY